MKNPKKLVITVPDDGFAIQIVFLRLRLEAFQYIHRQCLLYPNKGTFYLEHIPDKAVERILKSIEKHCEHLSPELKSYFKFVNYDCDCKECK